MTAPPPILVTGAHRSGTTWVGRMLALAPGLRYLHEPFNPGIARGPTPVHNWFEYVHVEAGDGRQQQFVRYLNPYLLGLRLPTWRRAWHGLRRLPTERSLVKDPLALFSAEWLAQQFEMEVVVMIRHPLAFVGSLKAKGWGFDFANFTRQMDLMAELGPFQSQVRQYAAQPPDLVAQAILLWNVLYRRVQQYQVRHPGWIFLRHEDLSRAPLVGFEELYARLGLPWQAVIEAAVRANSFSKVPGEIERNSRANLGTWKDRLSQSEIERVRAGTQVLGMHFYPDLPAGPS